MTTQAEKDGARIAMSKKYEALCRRFAALRLEVPREIVEDLWEHVDAVIDEERGRAFDRAAGVCGDLCMCRCKILDLAKEAVPVPRPTPEDPTP